MKPFLVVGAKGFHQHLVRLGFQLYDEIFDYSFDEEDTDEARCEGIAKNIKKISNLSTPELRNLYNILLSKLKFNKLLALKLATTVPDEVRDLWSLKSQFIDSVIDEELDGCLQLTGN